MKIVKNNRINRPAILVAAITAFAAGSASATIYQWDGGAGTGNWQTDTNWNPNAFNTTFNSTTDNRLNVNGTQALIYTAAEGTTVYANTSNSGPNFRGLVIGSGSDGTMIITGGTFSTAGSLAVDIIGNTSSNTGTLTINGGNYISGTHGLFLGGGSGNNFLNVQSGTATITTLSINTTFASTTSLTGGTLEVDKITTSNVGTYTINLDGGILKAGAGASGAFMSGLTNAYVKSNGAKIDSNGKSITIAQNLVDFTTPSGGGLTLNDTAVTKGTLTLSGTGNTYTGLTTVTAGALNITSTGSLRSGNALSVGASGTADFANAGQTLGAVDNANTITNALNFSASTGTVTLASLAGAGNTRFGSNGTVTGGISTGTVTSVGALNANISGGSVTAGGLLTGTISSGTVGAGSLSSTSVSGGTNSITGAAGITALSGGATTVGGIATIGTMSSGIANLNGATSAISTLSGGTVNLGTTVLTVNDGTMTSGTIAGSGGSLKKDSAGTLTLSSGGTYSYSGATTVAAGILAVNGSITSATTVQVNGTLGGNGAITGTVTVDGTLAPGNSIDSLAATSVSFANNANFNVEIDKTNTPRSDLLELTGTSGFLLSIASGANLNLTPTGTFSLGDRFTIASYTGGLWNGGVFDKGASGSAWLDGTVFNLSGYDWRINYDDLTNGVTNSTESYTDGGKYLTLTVVPEPSATTLGLLAATGLLLRRRPRQS